MKLIEEDGIKYALLPVNRTLTTEEYQFICNTLTPDELETFSVWITASLQERITKRRKAGKAVDRGS